MLGNIRCALRKDCQARLVNWKTLIFMYDHAESSTAIERAWLES